MGIEKSKYIRSDLEGKKHRLNIIDNPKRNILEDRWKHIKKDDLEIYFFLDKFQYLKENKVSFETEFYNLKYCFKKPKNELEFFYHFAYRLFAIHFLLMDGLLPFYAKSITKSQQIGIRLINKREFDDFYILDNKEKWGYLLNDFKILDKHITFNTKFEKAIIWYSLANISETNIETFMNFYRCIETFSNEIVGEEDISNTKKIKKGLIELRFNNNLLNEVIKVRNQIAHGDEFKIEFSLKVAELRKNMGGLIRDYIIRRIKNDNLIGLKNRQFIPHFVILKDTKSKEIKIIDMDDYNKEKDRHFNRNADYLIYSKQRVKEIAKKNKMTKERLNYILYCYDLQKPPKIKKTIDKFQLWK